MPQPPAFLSAAEAAERIRAALERRSGRAWTVLVEAGGRGWLRITAPPERRVADRVDVPLRRLQDGLACLSLDDERELAGLLGLWPEYPQGVPVPPSVEFYWEFVDRAEAGRSERPAGWAVD